MSFQTRQKEVMGLPLDAAEALARDGRTLRVRAGQIILATGSMSNDVYIVRSGRLRVTLFPITGREVIVRDVSAGQIFGELAAIDDQPRSASIVAVEDCVLCSIDAPAFRQIIFGSADAALWFARHLTHQNREMTDRIFELSALNARGRLHCQLLRMCADAGVMDNYAEIRPAPTHDHLAALIGSQREAVTRELSYLTEIGVLNRERRILRICDVQRLATLVRDLTGETALLGSA